MADPLEVANYTARQALFAITQCADDPAYVDSMVPLLQSGETQAVVDDLLRQSSEAVGSVAAYNQTPRDQLPPLTLLTYNFLVEDTLEEIKRCLFNLINSMPEHSKQSEEKFTRWFSSVTTQLSNHVNDVMNIKNQVLVDPLSKSRLDAIQAPHHNQVDFGSTILGQDEKGQKFAEAVRKRGASLASFLGVGANQTARLIQREKLDEAIHSTMKTLSLSAASPSLSRGGYSR